MQDREELRWGELHWKEHGQSRQCRWHSESRPQPPARVMVVDDRLPADRAWQLACEGTALLWRGDYHNARQLLQAMGRRAERSLGKRAGKAGAGSASAAFPEAFHQHRMQQAQRARTLGMVLVELQPGGELGLPRAPQLAPVLEAAFGAAAPELLADGLVLSLRELLGLIGAWQWQRKGVWIDALGAAIHPCYGVFSPLRGEYLELIARQPLPAAASTLALDVGTGSGVIAAVLARRGVERVLATDLSPRALACAAANLARLALADRVELLAADLFPAEVSGLPLIVCNPPWLPAKPSSTIEQAVYDPDSRMLRAFLAGVGARLSADGEAWLILSDLAEHLGLRSREQLLGWIAAGGLQVRSRADIRPRHGKAQDRADPLHAARAKEVTSLWCLSRS